MVIVLRHVNGNSEWGKVKNVISARDTLNFVKLYEVAHFGGKPLASTIAIELLLTPGYTYRLITDSDMALNYITAEQLNLPTS